MLSNRPEGENMGEIEVPKLEIAREFLDAAIEFFLASKNYFCAIHLAGAAEELLGAHLHISKRNFARAWKTERAMMAESGKIPSDKEAGRSVNEWKNAVKHIEIGTSPTIVINPAFAAEYQIGLALNNFRELKLPRSAAVVKLWDYQGCNVGKPRW